MSTIQVLDANGQPVTVNVPNADGPLPMAESRSVTIASDQTEIPVTPAVSKGVGPADTGTQRVTLATNEPVVMALGDPNDSPAGSDAGAFSFMAFIKRSLQNWTILLGRIPPLVGGSVPVVGQVGGYTARPTANFTRTANTTAYASGQLVANSTVAGSVVPLQFDIGRAANTGGMIRRVRIRKSGGSVSNASFRLHLYSAIPTPLNGDGGTWLTNQSSSYIGALDITLDRAFTDGAAGSGVPIVGSEINFTSQTVYGLLEARAPYVPVSGESFALSLEVIQN